MATNLQISQFLKYDKNLGIELPSRDLYITLNINTKEGLSTRMYKLSDLFVSTGKKSVHSVKNLKEFNEALTKGSLYTSKNMTHKILQTEVSSEGVVYEAIKIPRITESTTITQTKRGVVDVPYGYKRAFNVVEAQPADSNKDNYLFLQTTASKKPSFVKKSEIYYYDGLNKVYLKPNENLSELKNKNLYTREGYMIKDIYIGKQYEMDELIAQEKFDVATLTKETYTLSKDKDGMPVVKTEKKKIDTTQVEFTPATTKKPKESNPEVSTDVDIFKTRVFQYDKDGQYIKIRLKNGKKEVWINLDSVVNPETNETIKSQEELLTLLGKELIIKVGEEEIKSEKLTFDQANLRFNTLKTFERNDAVEPMSEDSYLLLRSGAYVKEKDAVEPICYNIVGDNVEKFDAYLAVFVVGDKQTEVVVDKNLVSKSLTDEIEINGTKVLKSSLKKLSRANRMSNCDVVQTSNENNEVETCKVLGKIKDNKFKPESEEAKKQILSSLKWQFEKDYLAGKYKVGQVFDISTNKFEAIRSGKYIYTDTFEVNDRHEDIAEYRGFKPGTIEYVEKNGRFVLKESGPKFDYGKANVKGLKNWKKFLVDGTGVALAAGFFAPVTVSAVWAASVVSLPFIPIINGIRKLASNESHIWKSLSKNQQKKDEAEALKQYEYLTEQTLNKKNKFEEVSKLNFLREYADIRKQILTLAGGQVDSDLIFKDCKAEVNVHNARLASKFKKEISEDNKELDRLEKIKKKALDKYNKLKAKYDKMKIPTKKMADELAAAEEALEKATNAFSAKDAAIRIKLSDSTHSIEPLSKNKHFDSIIKNADLMKNFVLVKKFGNMDSYGLTDEQKVIFEKLDFDLSTGKFKYKNKKFDYDSNFTVTEGNKNAALFAVISIVKAEMVKVANVTYESEHAHIGEYTDVIAPVQVEEVPEDVRELEDDLVVDDRVDPVEVVQPKPHKKRTVVNNGPFTKQNTHIINLVILAMEFAVKYKSVTKESIKDGTNLKTQLTNAISKISHFQNLLEQFAEKYEHLTEDEKNNIRAEIAKLYTRYVNVKDEYNNWLNHYNGTSQDLNV